MTVNLSSMVLDSNDTIAYQAPDWVYYVAGTLLLIIGFFGITFNLLAIIVFAKDSSIRTPFNWLLMNLVVLELFSAAFGLPINTISSFRKGWFFGQTLCTATAFTTATGGVGCITLLSILGAHRCIIICYPYCSAKINSFGTCAAMAIFSWIYTAAVVSPNLFGWSYFRTECLGISCGPAWNDPDNFSYTVYLLVMAFVIPVVVISSTSVILVYVMKRRSVEIQLASLKSSVAKKEMKVSRMVLSMTVSFLLIWSPYAICAIVVLSGKTNLLDSPLAVAPVVVAKTSTFINPVLYVIMNSQFRRSFDKIVRHVKPPPHTGSDDDDDCVDDKTVAMTMAVKSFRRSRKDRESKKSKDQEEHFV